MFGDTGVSATPLLHDIWSPVFGNNNVIGKTSLLATSEDKNPLVMCVIYSFNKYSLKTYCVAKHSAP